ncbi:hypothetical protein CR513_24378, partial [Mucuna pruriens]
MSKNPGISQIKITTRKHARIFAAITDLTSLYLLYIPNAPYTITVKSKRLGLQKVNLVLCQKGLQEKQFIFYRSWCKGIEGKKKTSIWFSLTWKTHMIKCQENMRTLGNKTKNFPIRIELHQGLNLESLFV